jgi:hypothetical protein
MTNNPNLVDVVKTWLVETYPNIDWSSKFEVSWGHILLRRQHQIAPNLLSVDTGVYYWADDDTPIKPSQILEAPPAYWQSWKLGFVDVNKSSYPTIVYGWNYIDIRHPNSFEILKTIMDSYVNILA